MKWPVGSGPKRNFKVVAGKVLADETARRFAFVREGAGLASRRVQQAIIQAGGGEGAQVTVLSDGAGTLPATETSIS
ncbi:MAG: hypothetical protein ACRD18_12565 [Terriglobia bacterium]